MKSDSMETLPERVAKELTEYIIDSDLKAGDKILNEFELAKKLSVGRSTIREAVKILVSRNILEIRRGDGTYVSKKKGISDDPLGFMFVKDKTRLAVDLLNVRFMMEPEIAAMAALNATDKQIRQLMAQCSKVEDYIIRDMDHTAVDVKFHQMIAHCSGNVVVENLIPIINSSVMVFVTITAGRLKNETIETHREIAEAIRDRDPDGAKYAMTMHLIYNRRRIMKVLKGEKRKGIKSEIY